MRHLRSLAIALVVLGLSTGAVFAAKTISDSASASDTGPAQARSVSGQVPGSAAGPHAAANAVEPDEQADETTGTDSTTGMGKPTDNHGAFVSSAAQLSFDQLKAMCATSGFVGTNKGAYMSAIARGELVVTVAKVTDGTTGTGIVATSCGKATTSTTGTTKLHGKANAAAKQAEQKPHP